VTNLILVPTQRELEVIRPRMADTLQHHDCSFQICGFGPIAAAARTGALLSRYKPERVILVGIAGSYTDRLKIGSAHRFDSVACDGVGVGIGKDFQCASELGWYQFNGDETEPRVADVVRLDSAYVDGIPSSGMAVTCCAASANRTEAQWRRSRFPVAVAEEMEGFAVALACSLARTPVQIVRGISNRVGDRDHKNWMIDQALAAATDFAQRLIPATWMPTP
jgi:futalosine hydrolase